MIIFIYTFVQPFYKVTGSHNFEKCPRNSQSLWNIVRERNHFPHHAVQLRWGHWSLGCQSGESGNVSRKISNKPLILGVSKWRVGNVSRKISNIFGGLKLKLYIQYGNKGEKKLCYKWIITILFIIIVLIYSASIKRENWCFVFHLMVLYSY